jgi:L-fuconolactonase
MAQADEVALEPDLAICDPHHHLWAFPNARYLAEEFLADLDGGHRIESTVFVECTAFYPPEGPAHLKYAAETKRVAEIAAAADASQGARTRIAAGIVGRVDLADPATVDEALRAHVQSAQGRFRGVRHAAGWDASPAVRNSHTNPPQGLYLSGAFRDGFARLADHGLSFDAGQFHTQLADVMALADAFPETSISLNHLGEPVGVGPYAGRRDEVFSVWAAGMRELAKRRNVHVKLGGLGMSLAGFGFARCDPPASSEELAEAWRPYVELAIQAFGVERAMFESNFPIDKPSCSYTVLWNAFKRIGAGASTDEKRRLFHDNAVEFYRLDPGVTTP